MKTKKHLISANVWLELQKQKFICAPNEVEYSLPPHDALLFGKHKENQKAYYTALTWECGGFYQQGDWFLCDNCFFSSSFLDIVEEYNTFACEFVGYQRLLPCRFFSHTLENKLTQKQQENLNEAISEGNFPSLSAYLETELLN
jgi:hypothetical protein